MWSQYTTPPTSKRRVWDAAWVAQLTQIEQKLGEFRASGFERSGGGPPRMKTVAVAGAKGASKKKAGQIDIPNSPWTPQGGPRAKYVLFPMFSLCTARPGVYFQIFVWVSAIVRDGSWKPLGGVEPLRLTR